MHSDQIAVAKATLRRGDPEVLGRIPNTPQVVAELVCKKLCNMDKLHIRYEEGPCGYGVYRQLKEMGVKCVQW